MVKRAIILTAIGMAWASVAHAQGHGYTPGDIENGGQLYQTTCTACHGPDGDGVPSINLGSGKFRRGTTDDEIVKIIIGGIPGTAMPPSSFSEGQAGTIVAYLRSLASSPTTGMLKGDAARGQALFTGKGQCQNCHSVAGVGARGGPSLSEVGVSRRAIERDGATITGRLLNQDTFTVQLLDTSGRLRLLDKSTIREFAILKESPMPSYKDKLNTQEIADLVTYLATLKGR
jgi:mono/diheme cytochrome c family protein